MSSAEPDARRGSRVEIAATVLLAVAAVLTAWSTYQSTEWRGEQAQQYSKGTAARIQASTAATRAGQQTQIDIATFIQWVDATQRGDARLARFYRQRFRPELVPAFDAWVKDPQAAPTPFTLPQYRIAETVRSDALNAQAGEHSDAAERANRRQGDYIAAVVLFATALFFAGIATKLGTLRRREVLLALGWLILVGTLVWIVTQPIRLQV
jgi:hypothetical protein